MKLLVHGIEELAVNKEGEYRCYCKNTDTENFEHVKGRRSLQA